MKLDSESVEVANMQRAKIRMESIVEKGIINGEVDWGRSGSRYGSWSMLRLGRSLARRLSCFGRVWEGSVPVWGVSVGC
jgi:hypothetical protein